MASLIEELVDVLNRECGIYRQLIPVAEEKTRVIVKNDLEALQKLTDQEQDAIDRIASLEHKREEVLANIRTVINRRSGEFNLKTLIKLMDKQPKEQRELSLAHDDLTKTIHTLVEINNRNKLLIQQSLEMIEFNMNFIQSARMQPGDNTYTKGASRREASAAGAGMFDARQ